MQLFALVAAILLALIALPANAGGSGSPNFDDPRELRLAAFQKYLEGYYEDSRALYKRAIDAAEKTYGKDSSFVADLYYEVGSISLEDGQFQTAENYLKLAVKQKPNSVMARVKYADVLTTRGQQGDAFQQIQEALKRSHGSPIAQQAMVKWMMSQASQHTAEGAIANVAATWECFRLHNMGKNAVQQTIASISNWQKGFQPAPAKKPVVAAASPPSVLKIVKPEPVKQVVKPKVEETRKVARIAPPVKKPKVRPKPEVRTAAKPVEKPPEIEKALIAKPLEMEKPHRVATVTSKKSKAGLVPPPPPMVPVFNMPPPPPTGFTISTQAQRIEKPKEKKKPKPQPTEQKEDEDPDYLLDWASEKKK